MPTRRRPVKINIPKRIEKWKSENQAFKVTEKIEKTTSNLFGLLELLIPNAMIFEACKKALSISQAILDKQEMVTLHGVEQFEKVISLKPEVCDLAAKILLAKALSGAEKNTFDSASPLNLGSALSDLLNTSFLTVGKIGMCFGFDVTNVEEHSKMLSIFIIGLSLGPIEKKNALAEYSKMISEVPLTGMSEQVEVFDKKIEQSVSMVGRSISKRRALAAVPAIQEFVGSSSAVWILKDVGEAAINLYAERFLQRQNKTVSEKVVVEIPLAA